VRTALSGLQLHRPRTLAEARRLLGEKPLVPLAGCTDLYVGLNFGTLGARHFLDLWGLHDLRGIRRRNDRLIIGALTTFAELGRSALVKRHAPTLAEAARQIGGAQIQNRATLGGNIANASPAADAVPVLAAAEATLVLAGAKERRVAITDFFTGYRRTALAPDELIVAVEIPGTEGAWFRKVGTRAANAISKVVMAATRGERPRIALGSVAPTVVRLPRTEEALAGGASLEQACAVLLSEIEPIDDLRSTAAYRRHVAANLLRQFWKETAP
jgi:CO/xanthine dehydrogenase FAD-binding subunit